MMQIGHMFRRRERNGVPPIRILVGAPAERYASEQGIRTVDAEYSQLDDFALIEERRQVMDALAALTDRYRALNQVMMSRATLRWMVAP